LFSIFGFFVIASCANQGGPPGGPVDRTGPQVVATFPDTFEVLAAFDGDIRIEFNERISERAAQGTLDNAVIISPESGEIRVRHSSRSLRVRMTGGFQPDQVYRVTVQPFVQDLFQNEMAGPFEFVFSTGAEMTPTVLAGSVIDRITEEPIEGVRVTARAQPPPGSDTPVDTLAPIHVATTDSDGVYALRYVPSGRYEVRAFEDRNRNRAFDGLEPSEASIEDLNPADTVLVDFALLAPDTTPALIGIVDIVDAATLNVEFDDFLDPAVELIGVTASLGPDSLGPPEVFAVMHERDFLVRRDEVQDSVYAADSIRFEEGQQQLEVLLSAGDSTGAAELESELTPPRARVQSSQAALRARELPSRAIYVLLADTLAMDRPFELTIAGVSNINGVPDGGGTAEVLREAPPP
jgi:hypothetical protein